MVSCVVSCYRLFNSLISILNKTESSRKFDDFVYYTRYI
nr:MAG TPA: hypothetical protein [Caudoviricetes sp.]